jgi:AI-2E family transporter
VPQAFLWGLMVGGLRFVPYLGSPVGGLMLVVLSVAIFPGWQKPLEVLGIFLVLELLLANVVEPVLFGSTTGVSPLALLFAAAFWAWLWGPIGLLLSTPLSVCLVVMGRHVPGLEFLGILLSDEPALNPAQRYYQRLLAHDADAAFDLVEEQLKTQPADLFFDDVLLPALVLARRDKERGILSPADGQRLLRDMERILDEVAPVRCPTSETPDETSPIVLAIPADDEGDELGLMMLRPLLAPEGCRLEVLSAGTTVAEVLSRVAEKRPAGVCIATLPPSGLAGSRYLCKRLRGRFPDLKILVSRWGQKDDTERMRERLKTAGADAVGATLLESRAQLLPLLKVDTEQRGNHRSENEELAAVSGVR